MFSFFNMAKKYKSLGEAYAKSFHSRLSADNVTEVVGKLWGGRPPCSQTGNKVVLDCSNINGILSFRKFDGRCIRLGLELEVETEEGKKTEKFKHYPCLDQGGPEGEISERLFKEIIADFYIPNLKHFYSLYKPKQ